MAMPPMSAGCGTPAWSPNGKLIVFNRSNSHTAVWGQLCVIGADGSGLRQLTRCASNQLPSWPCFSPDGRSIVFSLITSQGPQLDMIQFVSGKGFTMDLWRVELDGTGLRQLTHDGRSTEPAWGK
jgi:Tol biopolymer transport system component